MRPGDRDTVTFAFAVMLPAVAVMVVLPFATPVMGTGTLDAPAGMVTVAGTVAFVASLEFSVTVRAFTVAGEIVRVMLWPEGLVTVTLGGTKLSPDEVFVRAKLAVEPSPLTEATTLYEPVVPFAVKAGAVAMPAALVVAVAVGDPLKLPLAPLAGAVKVTVTPAIGLLVPSVTFAASCVANAALMLAL